MRVLVLFAHPVETSFQAELHRTSVEALRRAGHEVDDCDLNAEGFNPVLSRQERIDYENTDINRIPVEPYVRRLMNAEALVLNFPVWNFGFPAILKGYFDRVFLPGVSFKLENGGVTPALRHIRKVAAITTYGATRWRAFVMGDPPRKLVKRFLRITVNPLSHLPYLALYDMNNATEARCSAFLTRVRKEMETF